MFGFGSKKDIASSIKTFEVKTDSPLVAAAIAAALTLDNLSLQFYYQASPMSFRNQLNDATQNFVQAIKALPRHKTKMVLEATDLKDDVKATLYLELADGTWQGCCAGVFTSEQLNQYIGEVSSLAIMQHYLKGIASRACYRVDKTTIKDFTHLALRS